MCVFMPSRGPPCAGSASLGARDAREAKQGGRESNLGKAEAAKSAMPSRAGTMSQSAERETWRLRAGHASTARQRACRARKACVLDFWRLVIICNVPRRSVCRICKLCRAFSPHSSHFSLICRPFRVSHFFSPHSSHHMPTLSGIPYHRPNSLWPFHLYFWPRRLPAHTCMTIRPSPSML